jgi:2'-5' RNA ligase
LADSVPRGQASAGRDRSDPLGDEGRTSLMVVPPEEVCRAADLYRKECHPAAFERLPAHMTVLYPYAPPEAWPELLPRLTEAARGIEPLEVHLAAWGGGPHGFAWVPGNPEPFMRMRELFVAATPEEHRPKHGFRPHLTIGWSADGSLGEVWERVRRDPVDQAFTVDHLWLCRAGRGGYWELEYRIYLGTAGGAGEK